MKIIFIVLLIAAIGAGVYYYFSKKQKPYSSNFKELILAKWKIDSLVIPKDDTISDLERTGISLDSNYKKYSYRFTVDGFVFKLLSDSTKVDTSFYSWKNENELTWSQIARDSITMPLQVIKLNNDNLTLQSADSGKAYFKKDGVVVQ